MNTSIHSMTEDLSHELRVVIAEVRSAADWLKSPVLERELVGAAHRAGVHALSPWMDRQTAAAYCHCSPSEIDRGARAGVFRRYRRGGTALFRRDDLDAAITGGKWGPRETKTHEQ